MKRNLTRPGFEILFAFGIILMLMLPPIVLAQDHQELKVIIQNKDTTINGKNIKELSASEHEKASAQIDNKGSFSIVKDDKGAYRLIRKNSSVKTDTTSHIIKLPSSEEMRAQIEKFARSYRFMNDNEINRQLFK